jgi:hypothetical protein
VTEVGADQGSLGRLGDREVEGRVEAPADSDRSDDRACLA